MRVGAREQKQRDEQGRQKTPRGGANFPASEKRKKTEVTGFYSKTQIFPHNQTPHKTALSHGRLFIWRAGSPEQNQKPPKLGMGWMNRRGAFTA